MNYFTNPEISCPCCGKNNAPERIVQAMNLARQFAGIAFKINSWCRCEEHNEKVGGLPRSFHLDGIAIDISATTDSKRFSVIEGLLKAGFTRILIYPNFIHVDGSKIAVDNIIKLMPAKK